MPKNVAWCNKDYQKWKRLGGYGVFAGGPKWCEWVWNDTSLESARNGALARCRKRDKKCKILAENSERSPFVVQLENCGKLPPSQGIAVCTQLIETGRLRGYDLARVYNNRGIRRLDAGEYDLAVSDFTSAIKANKKHSWAYYNRGIAYENTGQFSEAIENTKLGLKFFTPGPGCTENCDFRQEAKARLDRVGKRIKEIEAQSNAQLCLFALDSTKNQWESSRLHQYSVATAKRRGLAISDCRVAMGYERALNPFEASSTEKLCAEALDPERVAWRSSGDPAEREAKRRNLDIRDCRIALKLSPDPVPGAGARGQ